MQAIPYDLVEMKPKDKPWITPKLKSLIDKRFQAYRKREFSLYYHYKEKLKKEIHKAKMHWVSKKRKAPDGLWSVVRNATNKNCKIPIHKITDSYPSLAEAANAINEKFGSLYPDLPSWTSILKDFNNSSSDWNVQLQVQDVLELLLKVNTSKACGSDELHPKIIKAAAHELAEPLTHLFAISIESGTIPKKWKLAHVVPVPKNKKPTLDTLRPISLLPIFSKLLEKVVLNSVLPSLLRLYGPNQFGFRPSTSTLHAHICIHDHVTRLLDCDEIAGVIMTTYDMSKAFDTLSHKALFSSLRESDLPNGFLNWCSNFLRDRKQSVRILHVTSTSIVNVTSGVPQGSVMAPYLFAAHMGKLAPNDGKCLTIKYADDIVTLIPAYNTSNVDKIVKDKIHDMEIWCKTHGLVLNSDKTNSLLIRKSGIPSNQLPATELMNRAELRILGVTYERNLSWSAHINNACKRASQRFYILRKLKRLLCREDLLLIYSSLIVSIFDYCGPLFVGINKSEEEQIESIRKRCHRINCNPECKCEALKPLNKRRETVALKVFKEMTKPNHILHHLIPDILPRTKHYNMPFCKTNRRQKSFIPFCIQLHNNSINPISH